MWIHKQWATPLTNCEFFPNTRMCVGQSASLAPCLAQGRRSLHSAGWKGLWYFSTKTNVHANTLTTHGKHSQADRPKQSMAFGQRQPLTMSDWQVYVFAGWTIYFCFLFHCLSFTKDSSYLSWVTSWAFPHNLCNCNGKTSPLWREQSHTQSIEMS